MTINLMADHENLSDCGLHGELNTATQPGVVDYDPLQTSGFVGAFAKAMRRI
jgi:hypothetical protein